MNKRLIVIIGAVLLPLIVWWLLKAKTSVDHPLAKENMSAPTTGSVTSPAVQAATSPAGPSQIAPVNKIVPQPVKSKVERMQEAWDAENSKVLDFYGKVVDQYGAPVVGVKIKAGVGLILGFERSGGRDYYTETDSKGRFSFVGIHGAGAGFTLTKEGYVYNQRLSSASRPDDYLADPDHPVVFPIWKLKGAEPMVHIEAHCGLACDGTATSFDLFTGKETNNGGDLTISLVRNPVSIDRSKPFDWTLTLQIAGGGLIPVETAYTNEAPAEGYQSAVTASMAASEKNWSPSFVQTYFFKAENGQVYGRITVNLMANYQPPPTHFEFEVYANPSGSRNLEFDPAKRIPVKP